MSSFLKQGLRKQQQKQKKQVLKRIDAIYGIINELDYIAEEINKNETDIITEENIAEIASSYSDLKIEGFEKLMLLSKLEELGKVNKEDILKDETIEDI